MPFLALACKGEMLKLARMRQALPRISPLCSAKPQGHHLETPTAPAHAMSQLLDTGERWTGGQEAAEGSDLTRLSHPGRVPPLSG